MSQSNFMKITGIMNENSLVRFKNRGWAESMKSRWSILLAPMLCSLALSMGPQVHAQRTKPTQVTVSVKILEFQFTKGVETGFSAYYAKASRAEPFGEVSTSGNAINNFDLTFPSSTAAGITIFLDRISLDDGDIEVVLQALVDENRAFILSRPRAMVKIGEETPTTIQTAQKIPYEDTQVVGSTTVQVTKFQDTGVKLTVRAPKIQDLDGDWNTSNDTFINLVLTAEVKEEGQRIVVALDDLLAGGDNFNLARNAISVPEFVSRDITTEVWVRNNQVLVLGGLYRNSETTNLSTAPWLTQGEDLAVGAIESFLSGASIASPLSATIGNRSTSDTRRELVFLVKAETWHPSFSIDDELGFDEPEEESKEELPDDVVTTIPNATEPEDSGDNK